YRTPNIEINNMNELTPELDLEIESLEQTCSNDTGYECITLEVRRTTFSTWDSCELFLKKWAKKQGFRIVKDRVHHEEDIIRRQDDSFWLMLHVQKKKIPEALIFINKTVNEHNHLLNNMIIKFKDSKKFTNEMMKDIKFMIISCKFDATAQRKFLESKFLMHPIYAKDLYATINKFHPIHKLLSNDAAQISNWLDHQKELDS
ncbi:12631_t:CDS:2, partial [Cetraspora pellucida]